MGGREGGIKGELREEGRDEEDGSHTFHPTPSPTHSPSAVLPSLTPPSPGSPHIFSSAVLEPSSVLLTDVPRCHAPVAKHHGPAKKVKSSVDKK